ncbi:MAG: hypothetical protein GF383_15945 [Candidatus Lokiarchaeota archaeon]|nr:hypothetical protein [Candidatus Lokiarchaeota archaeon]MBD3343197.1 hypothetical protein [Candidatus Lokiarchaeota archaeon]
MWDGLTPQEQARVIGSHLFETFLKNKITLSKDQQPVPSYRFVGDGFALPDVKQELTFKLATAPVEKSVKKVSYSPGETFNDVWRRVFHKYKLTPESNYVLIPGDKWTLIAGEQGGSSGQARLSNEEKAQMREELKRVFYDLLDEVNAPEDVNFELMANPNLMKSEDYEQIGGVSSKTVNNDFKKVCVEKYDAEMGQKIYKKFVGQKGLKRKKSGFISAGYEEGMKLIENVIRFRAHIFTLLENYDYEEFKRIALDVNEPSIFANYESYVDTFHITDHGTAISRYFKDIIIQRYGKDKEGNSRDRDEISDILSKMIAKRRQATQFKASAIYEPRQLINLILRDVRDSNKHVKSLYRYFKEDLGINIRGQANWKRLKDGTRRLMWLVVYIETQKPAKRITLQRAYRSQFPEMSYQVEALDLLKVQALVPSYPEIFAMFRDKPDLKFIKDEESFARFLRDEIMKDEKFLEFLEKKYELDDMQKQKLAPHLSWLKAHGNLGTRYDYKNVYNRYFFLVLKGVQIRWSAVIKKAGLREIPYNYEGIVSARAGTWAHSGFEYAILTYLIDELGVTAFYEAVSGGNPNHPDLSVMLEGILKERFQKDESLKNVIISQLKDRKYSDEEIEVILEDIYSNILQLNFDFFSGKTYSGMSLKGKRGYQGERKLLFVVLTDDQNAVIPKFSTSPRNDHVFVITKSQLFKLLGIEKQGATQKYAKLFDAYHRLYTKVINSNTYLKILKKRSKVLSEKLEGMVNIVDGVEVPVTSDGYREFCEDHPNKDIRELYTDYILPPQDCEVVSNDKVLPHQDSE